MAPLSLFKRVESIQNLQGDKREAPLTKHSITKTSLKQKTPQKAGF
jgi:hypothetical protein